MKKILAILLAVVMTMVMLAGCGRNNQKPMKAPMPTAAVTPVPTPTPTPTPIPVPEYKMTEYRSAFEDSQGYKIETICYIGNCIVRGYETDKLNAIWKSIGGKGDMPSFDGSSAWASFSVETLTKDLGFVFGTVSFKNLTPEGFSLTLNPGVRIYVNGGNYNLAEVFFKGTVQYDNELRSWVHPGGYSPNADIAAGTQIDWKTWGPVPFVLGIGLTTSRRSASLFSPKFPDGDPAFIKELCIRLEMSGDKIKHDITGWDVEK